MGRTAPLLLALTLLAALPACAEAPEAPLEQTDDALTTDTALADADAAGRVSARAGVLTLTFDSVGTFATRDGERTLLVKGRSSRNLQEIHSFVPDDAFGEVSLTSPRTFEIALRGGHEINSILSGLPLRLAIETQSGSPKKYEAAVHLGARLIAVAPQDSRLRVVPELRPVYGGPDDDALRYRARLELTSTPETVTVESATMLRRSPRRFDIDWSYGALAPSFVEPSPPPLHFLAKLGATTAKTDARVALSVVRLGVTTKTVEEAWPATCRAVVRNCIARGTSTECGTYREVQQCKHADPPTPPNITQAAARIRADILAKTGLTYSPAILSIRTEGARTIALTALGRGGSGEFAIGPAGPGSSVSFLGFVDRPSFFDSSLVQRFEAQLPSLGMPSSRIVAHGKTAGQLPLWHFVIERNGVRSTVAVQATSATTSVVVPFTYDLAAFREMTGHLVVEHAMAMAKPAGLYAELEVALRATAKLATASGIEEIAEADSPVGFSPATETQLGVFSIWGDNAVFVTMVRATGNVRVADFN